MADPTAGTIEPVHWHAHLIRSPEFCYTEVEGTPILVRPRDHEVVALTPTWASIWVQLDGRPVTEALQVDPSTLNAVDRRNMIEVLRRLKAKEVIEDIPPGDIRAPGQDLGVQSHLRDHVKLSIQGSFTRVGTDRVLTVDPAQRASVTVIVAEASTGAVLHVKGRFRKRRVDRCEVTDARNPMVSESAIERFAALIEAVVEPDVLFRPGLVDLFAEVAERASAPASLPL